MLIKTNRESVANWGTRACPCPTLNIEEQGSATCKGIAFEFDDQQKDKINAYLVEREGKNFELRPLAVTGQEVGSFEAVVPVYSGKT